MEFLKKHCLGLFLKLFQVKPKAFVLLFSLVIASQTAVFSQVSFEGSWGVTFPIFGGERMDSEIARTDGGGGKDYIRGAQEIVDELPTAGHVITNLSYFAHSHYYNTRANTNVDVANEIHPAIVPSIENDGVAVEAIQLLRNSGKKIILYISTNYLDRASDEIKAGWVNYYNTNFGGDEYAAYRHLVQGFVEAAAGYADGYWLDTTGKLRGQGRFEDFVAMIREADPTALIASGGSSRLQHNGEDVYVDSDGINDTNSNDYYVKLYDSTDGLPDFTDGHIVPLASGAPPNSWSYEEFMIPNMMVESSYIADNGKKVQKHGWFPIRARWHSPSQPLIFETEQAYRFVRRVTDYGGMITFANTNETPNLAGKQSGNMMSDEMDIMMEINRRMLMNPKPDYVPYTRPEGASLVGETQYIEFPDISTKEVGDPDFIAATATSGLAVSFTSSNTNVATIVNGKVRIVGPGKTTITATQAGGGAFTSAVPAERPLVVTGEVVSKQDQVITFPSFPSVKVGDSDFDPGATASSGLPVTYTSGNTSVAIIVNGKIRILSEGSTNITVTQVGDGTYNAAPNRSRVLKVLEGEVVVTPTFTPDPNTTYYIDSPYHNLRLAADGEQGEPLTVPTSTTGADVEWQFVAKGNGSWHIQRAAGGDLPRLRTDNTVSDGTAADMQGTAWNGTYTYFDFEEGAIDGTYFITLPDGPAVHVRLQIDNSGSVQMVENTRNGTWESFKITEVQNSGVPIGQTIWLQSLANNRYVRNNDNDGDLVEANTSNKQGAWVPFTIEDAGGGMIALKSGVNGKYVAADIGVSEDAPLYANRDEIGSWEKFTWINNSDGTVSFQANSSGNYVVADMTLGGNLPLMANRTAIGLWEKFYWDTFSASKELVKSNVLIYPNPIDASATIQGAAKSTINVYDLNGKIVFTKVISSESEIIDLSNLVTGMYYGEVIGASFIASVKIVKQ